MSRIEEYKKLYIEKVKNDRCDNNSFDTSLLSNTELISTPPWSIYLLGSFLVRTIKLTNERTEGDARLDSAFVKCELFYLDANDQRVGPIPPLTTRPCPEYERTNPHRISDDNPSPWYTFFCWRPNDPRRDYNNGGWILDFTAEVSAFDVNGRHQHRSYGIMTYCNDTPPGEPCWADLPHTDINSPYTSRCVLCVNTYSIEGLLGYFEFEILSKGIIEGYI